MWTSFRFYHSGSLLCLSTVGKFEWKEQKLSYLCHLHRLDSNYVHYCYLRFFIFIFLFDSPNTMILARSPAACFSRWDSDWAPFSLVCPVCLGHTTLIRNWSESVRHRKWSYNLTSAVSIIEYLLYSYTANVSMHVSLKCDQDFLVWYFHTFQ